MRSCRAMSAAGQSSRNDSTPRNALLAEGGARAVASTITDLHRESRGGVSPVRRLPSGSLWCAAALPRDACRGSAGLDAVVTALVRWQSELYLGRVTGHGESSLLRASAVAAKRARTGPGGMEARLRAGEGDRVAVRHAVSGADPLGGSWVGRGVLGG